MKYRVLIISLLLMFSLSAVISADQLTGEEIIDRLKDDSTLTGSGTATIRLITENSKGEQRENKLKIYRKDDGQVESQLLEYLEPADVEGTKFLSINDPDNGDQMWLYLPVLGRERRIAGHMTQDNFMNTDFTYEEIGGSRDYNDNYQAERLADEEVDGYNCYQVKLLPEDEDSEYSQLRMWVWQEEFIPLKIDFYNLDGQLSKQLSFSDLKKEEDGDYTPQKIVMGNVLAETKTIIKILESSSAELPDDYFSKRYLRK